VDYDQDDDKRGLLVFGLVLLGGAIFLVNLIEESPRYWLVHDFAIESSEFLPSLAGATNTPFAPGNRIDIFNNGDQFYPAMLEAIGRARRTITIEAYIYWAGEIGRKFAEAIAARARSASCSRPASRFTNKPKKAPPLPAGR
jgi:cardiolipin synthase